MAAVWYGSGRIGRPRRCIERTVQEIAAEHIDVVWPSIVAERPDHLHPVPLGGNEHRRERGKIKAAVPFDKGPSRGVPHRPDPDASHQLVVAIDLNVVLRGAIMSRRCLAPLICVAASKPPIQNESKTCGRAGAKSRSMREGFLARLTRDLRVERKGLRHNLVHVVVLVGRQPADEVDAGGRGCQHLVFPI